MSFKTTRSAYHSNFQQGDKVVVVAGRKVPHGVKGKIFWVSEPQVYGPSRFPAVTYRIGIKDEAGRTYWTYDRNVQKADIKADAVQNLIDAENYANDIDPEVENNLDGTVEW